MNQDRGEHKGVPYSWQIKPAASQQVGGVSIFTPERRQVIIGGRNLTHHFSYSAINASTLPNLIKNYIEENLSFVTV
ncbi:hypothetical protein [Deinococcus hopiensis]|uniref:hypothetical protein n=1 Tax=Deinococcus hopiensis TaxID=309885 RepID=UPI00111BEF04|nr:hypothetical protein [Deinococcus hopiensis]